MKKYTDCMEVREDFSAYLDDELSADEREPLEAHLAGCAECLREMDALKRVDDSYRALAPVGAPGGFEEGVRHAVRTGRMPAALGRRPVPRWMGPLVAMASAAAVLLIGVLILESRQVDAPTMLLADAPDGMQSSDAAAGLMKAPTEGPAAEADANAAPGAPAATAWDEFARPPARDDKSLEQFVQPSAPSSAAPTVGGREDSGESLAEGLADAGAAAERDSLGATSVLSEDTGERARAELIGAPPAETEEESRRKVLDALESEKSQALSAPSAAQPEASPVQAGEIMSRQKLRTFHVLAGGLWVEEGYDHQPTTPLKRESRELHELMRKFPTTDWGSLLERSARQVFQIGDAWYDLEAAADPAP